ESPLDRPGGPARLLLPDQGRAAGRPAAARRVRADCPDDAVHLGTELEASLRDLAVALHLSDVSGDAGPGIAARPRAAGERPGAVGAADGDDLHRGRGPVRGRTGP